MEPDIRATIFSEGGKIIGQVIRLAFNRPRKSVSEEPESSLVSHIAAKEVPAQLQKQSAIALPTKEQTTLELKRRLAKELYRAELDLASGLKIAGKPCTCLESKHTLMMEAAAEELISEDPSNSVYPEIIQWIKQNQSKVTVQAISSGKYAAEYPQMAAQFRDFRKRVMGTAALSDIRKPGTQVSLESVPGEGLTLDQAKKIAAAEAAREVERQWHSLEKK